jgi:hypothetical protein
MAAAMLRWRGALALARPWNGSSAVVYAARRALVVGRSLATAAGEPKGENATTPPKKKKKHYRDPSLRVRIVPMFQDNYGALLEFC